MDARGQPVAQYAGSGASPLLSGNTAAIEDPGAVRPWQRGAPEAVRGPKPGTKQRPLTYTGPKVRLSRKLGVSLTPKADKFLEKKPYPPGMHGFRRRRRLSPYGTQLLEKQRLRFQYNVSER